MPLWADYVGVPILKAFSETVRIIKKQQLAYKEINGREVGKPVEYSNMEAEGRKNPGENNPQCRMLQKCQVK